MNPSSPTKMPNGNFKEILRYSQSDKFAACAFIIYLCHDFMVTGWNYLSRSFYPESFRAVLKGIMIIAIVFRYFTMDRSKKIMVLPYYLVSFGAIVYSLIYHPEYKQWFYDPFYGIRSTIIPVLSGIWMLMIVGLFTDKRKLLNCLILCARLMLIYYIYSYILFLRRGYWSISRYGNPTEYDLEFGYEVLIWMITLAYAYLNHRKIYDLVLCIVGFFLIARGGSRGPFIPLAVFVIMMYIQNIRETKQLTVKQFLIAAMAFLSALLIYLFFDEFCELIIQILSKFSKPGRLVESILKGTVTDGSGREEIWKASIDMIKKGGPFGYGFYGDRIVIGKIVVFGYPHNIFLELLIEFGWLLGGGICIALIYITLRFFIKNKEPVWAMLGIIFFCGTLKLMLSNSFWYHRYFWGFLAVIGLWYKQQKQGIS